MGRRVVPGLRATEHGSVILVYWPHGRGCFAPAPKGDRVVGGGAPQAVGPSGQFPSTHWSCIDRARADTASAARPALAEVLRRYRPALFRYLAVGRRIDANDADDLLQGFISSEILERHLVARAQPDRGRFRALLLTALDRYVSRNRRSARALKRAPERAVSLDDLTPASGPADAGPGPSEAFDVAWGRQVIAQALENMRRECEASRRPDLWAVFEGRVLAPTLEGAEPVPYEELVRRFGLQTPRQASNAVITAKRMFARHLAAVVGEYAGADEVEAEVEDLVRVLSRCGAASGAGW